MQVEKGGVSIEFDCAEGKIEAPLVMDSQGRFTIKGKYVAEVPGPAREDDVDRSGDATYSGKIQADVMQLDVRVTGAASREQSYRLVHGQQVRMIRCN